MNEQTDEQTMQREWLELQRQRYQLDAERDKILLEHIARQTEAMERMARAMVVLLDAVVTRSAG